MTRAEVADGVRHASVAGRFYEGRADRLAAAVDGYLADARAAGVAPQPLIGIVVPHAGHVYSGPTAAFAYAAIDPAAVRRVVILGPAHFVPVEGIGLSSARAWRTPLGDVPVDLDLAADLRAHVASVVPADTAHGPEHNIEVQLPFLQRVLEPGWALLPLIVGADVADDVATVIARCTALPGTLLVLSTDLSHYLDQASAIARDARTISAIVDRDPTAIGPGDACGRLPLRGLLIAAAANDWTLTLLDARTSGDTAGDRDRVVGYAAFTVTGTAGESPLHAGPADIATPDVARISPESRAALLALGRATIEEGLRTGRRPSFDARAWGRSDPVLRGPGAAFVTLRSTRGDLLGCIGSLAPTESLAADVAAHAYDAAFRDPRFPPMTPARAAGMVLDISVLTPATPLPVRGYDDLVGRLPVGSGLTVSAPGHRGTFLPAVWEQLPGAPEFVAALWHKAGLRPGAWPAGIACEVYGAEEFAEPVG